MGRITTLNEDKGRAISDLEALMVTMEKLLNDKLEQKPNAGITFAKGQPNEKRFKYTEARVALKCLEEYFDSTGCFSIGVCDTCASFSRAGHGNRNFGTCKKHGMVGHCWNSCSDHSKKGGGYGI